MNVESDSGSSTSSDDDDNELQISEEFEKTFLKTLSSLKNRDPSIYDQNKTFFDESSLPVQVQEEKDVPNEKPMFLKDYERKLLTEGGFEEEEGKGEILNGDVLPYSLEQRKLKESFKNILNDSDEEDDGELLKPSVKSEEDVEKREADYIQWLKGQKQELEDKNTEENLKKLRDFWNSDDLGEDEAFLRDYILNKRFLEKDDSDDSDDLSEESETLEAQEHFEQEYNFRHENEGGTLVRRFPRNIDNSLRRKDNKRSKKRSEVKERKELDKKKKIDEINRQKKLKRREISERLDKLKELTGNEKLAFNDDDILNDFDPDAHDRKMTAMYSDDFYSVQDEEKPTLDGLEAFGNYDEVTEYPEQYIDYDEAGDEAGPSSRKERKKTRTKKKKERKKNTFSDILTIEKPIYDSKVHESYQKYMDEYYQLDCEDFIDDIPCRFKYKQVQPNDFGLTVEEILTADEKELNRWSSIKKLYKIRSNHVEKNEANIYKKKGQNELLKMKILPSLFKTEDEHLDNENQIYDKTKDLKSSENTKEKKKASLDQSNINTEDYHPGNIVQEENGNTVQEENENTINEENIVSINSNNNTNEKMKNKSTKRKRTSTDKINSSFERNPPSSSAELKNHFKNQHKKSYGGGKFKKNHNFHDSRLSAYGINPKKYKFK